MKPTKEQVKDTIAMIANCPWSEIKYDHKKKVFIFIELIPKPHYDSGHGVDAVDFDEIPSKMSWKEALSTWRYHKNLCKPSRLNIPVVSPLSIEEDLPF